MVGEKSMSKAVFLITSQTDKALEIAEAWQSAGAPGVTLLASYGLRRLQERSRSLELPLFVSMASVLRDLEETSEIIFSIVEASMVDSLLAAAEEVLGDLLLPNTGILFVIDVERVVGMRRHG